MLDSKVCVLERGRPFPPNSFPRSPYWTQRNFWDPSAGLYGMFNLWSFQGIEALVSSGLGGGSLIYANVLIRKDERWFVKEDLANGGFEYWPITRDDLEPHYDRVEKMLDAQTFPLAHEPYAAVPKTRAFKEAAGKLGLDWFLPNLAVTFANPGEVPCRASRSKKSTPTSTAARGTRVGCAANATSAATTAARTPSTTTIYRRQRDSEPTSAR